MTSTPWPRCACARYSPTPRSPRSSSPRSTLGARTLAERLPTLGLVPLQGETNFQLISCADRIEPGVLVDLMHDRGYLVKGPFTAPCLADCIRVTLGPSALMARSVTRWRGPRWPLRSGASRSSGRSSAGSQTRTSHGLDRPTGTTRRPSAPSRSDVLDDDFSKLERYLGEVGLVNDVTTCLSALSTPLAGCGIDLAAGRSGAPAVATSTPWRIHRRCRSGRGSSTSTRSSVFARKLLRPPLAAGLRLPSQALAADRGPAGRDPPRAEAGRPGDHRGRAHPAGARLCAVCGARAFRWWCLNSSNDGART